MANKINILVNAILDRDRSYQDIQKQIKRIQNRLEPIKLNIDINDKTLSTISEFIVDRSKQGEIIRAQYNVDHARAEKQLEQERRRKEELKQQLDLPYFPTPSLLSFYTIP